MQDEVHAAGPVEMQENVLVFHIGDHKTGTTTIQNALAAECFDIEGAELRYPAPLNHNYLMARINAHLNDTEPPPLKAEQMLLSELADYVRNAGPGYTVISGEVFENLPPDVFQDILNTFFKGCADRIRVVAYVRPHAQRILSSYAEQIKIGWFLDPMQTFFEHNLESRRFHYAPRFAKWREIFGDDFVLRPMTRKALRNGSILEDFAYAAFDGRPCAIEDYPAENQAVSLRELALLKYLQGQFQDKEKWLRHTLGWELARRLEQMRLIGDSKSRKLTMSKGLVEKVRAAYFEDARAVDQMFFGDQTWLQDAFDEAAAKAPIAEQRLDPEVFFSADQLRNLSVLARMIGDMLDVKAGWPAYFHRHRIEDVRRFKARKTRSASLAIDPIPADAGAGRTGSEKD